MVPAYTIALLEAGDAPVYNAFFAAGGQAHPEAFRIVPRDFRDTPFATAPSPDAFTLGAFGAENEGLLGVVSVERETGRAKRRHVAWLIRMYVAQSAAGRGIGRSLVREAVRLARERFAGVTQLNLTVIASNEPARRLYLSEGFVVFAREIDALRDENGLFADEEQMRFELGV